MGGVSQRHQAVLEELTEWWDDLCTRGTRSRVVLVEVPSGWGRSTLLDQFAAVVEGDGACWAVMPQTWPGRVRSGTAAQSPQA